jgi:hypothetical protein
MSCVVTGAPFNMLAELPITTASSVATRRALATATSVSSEKSEDVSSVLPASDEHCPVRRRQEQAAHDQPEIARIDLRKLWGELRADLAHLAREALRIRRSPAARSIPARGCSLRGAPAAPAFAAHRARVHGAILTEALGFR